MTFNVIVLTFLLIAHALSFKTNFKKSLLLNHTVRNKLINHNQKRSVTGDQKLISNRNGIRHHVFPYQRQFRIKKSDVGVTEKNDKGYVIIIDADKRAPKLSKRDQVADVRNSSVNDNDSQKDIYNQLKNRFEKIEQHLESFSKQKGKDEPQVRVIVISPKTFNVTDGKSLNLADLENAAAFSKDNLFVKDISTKEYDETIANVIRKKEAENGANKDTITPNTTDESDHEKKKGNGKNVETMSPLLADKDTLNEVVREINMLRNYTRNENSSGTIDRPNILDDVMAIATKEVERHDHDVNFASNQITELNLKPASDSNKENADQVSKNEVVINNKTETNEASPKVEDSLPHKKVVLPPSNPEPKYANLNLPNQHESFNQPPTMKIHTEDDKKGIKSLRKDTKSPVEQIAKEFMKTTASKRNGSEGASTSNESAGSEKAAKKIIDKQKAEAIIEFLNKDPLEVWRYSFKNLHALALNSTLLRSGLVNAGNIERLKGVMRRALEGKSVTISIVGGSISAGGGLYKDEKSISGLYYKGLIDWWQKMITPLTGADMIVNNVAIGSIGTDYFSYCVKNHIANESDIVLWELSANDYNRYKMQPTKGARPLERFTRMVLELPNKPALIYINFFKGVDFKATRESCPDFEDQGEDIIAHYYRIPSLSWRAMVCNGLVNKVPGYGMETLFSQDEYHPSIRGHAQMSLLILLHLRHVMRAVLQWAIAHDGFIERFEDFYTIPEPLFMGPKYPEPLCWSLISPDLNQKLTNSLYVRVKSNDGFKLEYATNFPIRFDKVVCWKAEKPHATIGIQFYIPEDYGPTGLKRVRSEVAITTHTRWGGSSSLWIDDQVDRTIVIKEGREHDPGKRTQVDSLVNDVGPGYHILHARAHEGGFCLSAIMVDSS